MELFRAVRRSLILASCVCALMLSLSGEALAHAVLVGTDPANESTIEHASDEVLITFSENVGVAFGGVKAFGPDGAAVGAGEATASAETVTLPLRDVGTGTYAVAWRVISADGHPVRGAFVFHVGEKTADAASRERALEVSDESRALVIAFGVARAGLLAGVLLAVGSVLLWLLPGNAGRIVVGPWLALAVVSMVATYVLDAAVAGGFSVGETLSGSVLAEQAGTVYGRATVIRLVVWVVACAAWLVIVRPGRRSTAVKVVAGVVFAALAASLSLSGHAIATDPVWLRLPLDMTHSLAAAAWVGGLVALLVHLRRREPDVRVVRGYSTIALASVVILVATGLYAAWTEIGLSLDGLLDTTYGRLVLVKSVLLVATMPLAALNRNRHVPALSGPDRVDVAALRLKRFVAIEIVLLAIVVAATAWLVQTIPAKVALRPGFVEQTVELRRGSVQLVIDPAEAGANEVHVYVLDESQQPDSSVTQLVLTASNKKRQIHQLPIELRPAGPGHYTTSSVTVPFAGKWQFTVRVRRGEFDEQTGRFTAEIASAQP